jgi:hypothetical protein
MIAVVPADRVGDALAVAAARNLPAWPVGRVDAHADLTSSETACRVEMASNYTGSAGFRAL